MAKNVNDGATLIAVHETSQHAGLVTWWQLKGGLQLEELSTEWERAGFDSTQLPKPIADATALRRSLVALYPKADVISLPKVSGYAVVEQTFVTRDDEEQPDPVQVPKFKAWHDKEGALKVSGDGLESGLKRNIFRTMQGIQQTLEAHDLSGWLTGQSALFHAVSLRPTGGVYFIPSQHVERWRKLSDIVQQCSKSSIFEIPALRTEKAVDAILAALRHEVEAEVERMTKLLNEGEMGVRALNTRRHETTELLKKVGSYESLLSTNLASLADSVETVQRRIFEAVLAAEEV